MKKLLSVFLVLVCLCSLSACSKNVDDQIDSSIEENLTGIADVDSKRIQKALRDVSADSVDEYYLQLNEQNRIQNQGSFFIDKGWIYGQSWDDNGDSQFVKVRTDDNDWTVLDKGFAKFIYVIDNYIYYMKSGKDYGIYKMRTSGEDKKRIAKVCGQMQIAGDSIYYVDYMVDGKYDDTSKDASNYHLYRCDLNGKNKEEVINKPTFYFFVFDDGILYQDDRDNMSLHHCDQNGENDFKVNDIHSFAPIYDGEYIYYHAAKKYDDANTYSIRKVKPDGTDDQQVVDCNAVDGMLLVGEYIYFVNSDDGNRLHRIKKDGSDVTLITQDKNIAYVQLFDETIKYTKFTDDSKYIENNYFCDYDGSGKWVFEKD